MPDDSQPQQRWTEAQTAAIRAQLARLLEGASLRSAPRQQRLLRHIVEATLAGDADRLKGYTLGVEVFDRGADFDPNVDPIVRIEAGRLRSKLLAHYAGEGADDSGADRRAERRLRGALRIPAPDRLGPAMGAAGALDFAASRRRRPPSIALIGRDGDVAALGRTLAEHRLVYRASAPAASARPAWRRPGTARFEQRTSSRRLGGSGTHCRPVVARDDVGAGARTADRAERRSVPGLLAALRPVIAWLVLDNAEHLIEAVAPAGARRVDAAPGSTCW